MYFNKKRKNNDIDQNNIPKKRRRIMDDEISEESDDFFVADDVDDVEDTGPVETVDEKRVRMANEYIKELEAMDQMELESDFYGDNVDRVAGVLMTDSLVGRTGRDYIFKEWADDIIELNINMDNILSRKGHKLPVTCLRVSNDEKFVFTGSKDCCIIKWSIDGERLGTINGYRNKKEFAPGHTGHVLSLALTYDGKLLASGGKDKVIKLWNAETLELVDSFAGHKDFVSGLTFRQGTYELYSASYDRCVKLWNCENMTYIDTLYGHQSPVTAIDSLRKERAVTASFDQTLRCWKIVKETQLVFRGAETSCDCVAMLTEDLWVTGTQAGDVLLYSVIKKKPKVFGRAAHGGEWISSVAAYPYSDLIATGSCDGFLKLWKVEKKGGFKLVKQIPLEGWINSIQFSKSGKYLIAGVGSEHSMGRWKNFKKAKNGMRVIQLKLDNSDE